MVTYKKIVVPTDGSENAKRALEHAIAVADRNEAELIIVHVANIVSAISNFDQTPISGGYVSEQIAEDMEETGKEILNDVVKDIPDNVVAVGNPCRVLRKIGEHDHEFFYKNEKIDWENL